MPTIEEAKKDLVILEREIELLRSITDNTRELSTHDDMDGGWYHSVSMKTSAHLTKAINLHARIKKQYNL